MHRAPARGCSGGVPLVGRSFTAYTGREPHMSEIQSISDALRLCRRHLIAVGVFSFIINFLTLTPLFYMMNIFDKAVANSSFPTLIALAVIALFLYSLLMGFEWIRSLVLIQIGKRLDDMLAPRLYGMCFEAESGIIQAQGVGSQPMKDLNSLRQFMGSSSMTVIFDLPWTPLLLLIMYFFHPSLAVVAVISIIFLTLLAIVNQRSTTKALTETNKLSRSMTSKTEKNLRNAEVAAAMGMMGALTARWRTLHDEIISMQNRASGTASGFQAFIKTTTLLLQSVAITSGAVLVMQQEIPPSVMIAAALLLGKCTQPFTQAVSSWKGFVDAREQWLRLDALMADFPLKEKGMKLPALKGRVLCERATVMPPGSNKPTLAEIDMEFLPGTITVVIGPSGAGKSSLVRALLGLWPTVQGEIRLDGTETSKFHRDDIGREIGYLPQDIELFEGSVAENISRFGGVDPTLVYQAAEEAGIVEMIQALPDGFDTVLDSVSGTHLSQGQRQRIALARAIYGTPKLLILDEPNSNLDDAGERALANCIKKMANLGATVIVVSHRSSVLPLADNIAMMMNGRVRQQGPRDQILAAAREAKNQSAAAGASNAPKITTV